MKFIELPKNSVGMVFNNRNEDTHWGKNLTIEALQRIGRLWNEKYPNAPFSVGQISRKNGEKMPPHVSHRLGRDVDFRPMRFDLANSSVTIKDVEYSRELTEKLIRMIRENSKVKLILFNDSVLIAKGLCQAYQGHHNHFHVRFNY